MSEKENSKKHDRETSGTVTDQPNHQLIDIMTISLESLQDWRGGGRE
jgi:hypothetical protein